MSMNKFKSLLLVSSSATGIFTALNLWQENEKFYDVLLMPMLKKLEPETAHNFVLYAAKFHLVPKSRYKDPDTLKTHVWGLRFKNPVGIAAGFDKQAEAVETLHDLGFGFVEVGSVTPLPQPGSEKPRLFRLEEDNAVINRFGFNSEGHEVVYERVKKLKRNKNLIIGVNLGKNKNSPDPIKDYVEGMKKFADVADYLVVNVSSPNTPGLRGLQNKQMLEELLSHLVKARNDLPMSKKPPLLLKLAPDLSQEERKDIAEVIMKTKSHVDGLVVSNTTTRRPKLVSENSREEGGLSGQPLQDLSTQLIADMYALTKGTIPVIGVGGVFTGLHAYEKICAGASLIQIYTSFAYHGPPRITKIKKELDDLLRSHGYSTVADAVGKGFKNPS